MGKALTPRGTARRKRRIEPARQTHPVHRTPVPLVIDGGNGVTYRVAIVESIEYGMHVDFDHDARTCRVRATDDARELMRRLKNAAEVIAEMASKEAARQHRRELAVEVEQLGRLVDVGTPTNSTVRHAFRNAGMIGDGIDDFLPADEQLQNARDAFYRLPIDQQRDALNGWSPTPDRPTVADVAELHEDLEVRRVLTLDVRPDRVTCDHEFITQVGSFHVPVCVVVQEGTSKIDALRCLDDAMRLIRDAWPVLVDESSVGDGLRSLIVNRVRDGQQLDDAIAAVRAAAAGGGNRHGLTLPARVMFDGTTDYEPIFKLLSTSDRNAVGTQLITAESVDRHGQTIRVGDTIVEADGSIIATQGTAGAGRVLAVAGSAVIYSLGRDRGYSTATASECYVVAANEKGGASQTPNTPELGGNRSGEAKAATSAA